MDWYKFSIVEHQRDTAEMPDAEDLAYRRLMDLYYLNEGPIPVGIDELVDLVRLDADVIEPVLEGFFKITEQGYLHEGWQVQIEARIARRLSNQQCGRLGGRGKKRVV